MENKSFGLFLLLLLGIIVSCTNNHKKLVIGIEDVPNTASEINYAVNRLQNSSAINFVSVENNPDYIISSFIDTVHYKPESFEIIIKDKILELHAGSPVGIMYGMLNIKDQAEQGNTKLEEKSITPAVDFRAIKFNLPWASYRNGKSIDFHKDVCRDLEFWESFLDMMVENRFNVLKLASQHPFPLMVKTEKYPEACGLTDAELLEWQDFWHGLFKMAKDRGIETYLRTFNIFVSPEFAQIHNVAAYSIENKYNEVGDTSEIIKDYTRESVKAVIDTYPNLTGFVTTLGEAMGGMSHEERAQWLEDTYFDGMKMASRKIKFVYRGLTGEGDRSSDPAEMMRERLNSYSHLTKGPIILPFKFNGSHAYATTTFIKDDGQVNDTYWNPEPENYKLAFIMRNEDFFVLRWGQPDFIREVIEKNTPSYVAGFFVGSESYIPAKDYFTSLPGTSNKYAFERQWMYYKMWGRLLYDPQTPNSFFENEFKRRFPESGEQLFSAQTKASRIPLVIGSYMDASWDFTLYSEGFLTYDYQRMKVIPLKQLASKRPLDPSFVGVKDYLRGGELDVAGKISPLELADSVETFCNEALAELAELDEKRVSQNVDLLYEASDMKAWSYIGLYFANKLRAAFYYQKFKTTKDSTHHQQSVKWLEEATKDWEQLVATTDKVYDPMPLLHHIGYSKSDAQWKNYDKEFHWKYHMDEVYKELEWLKSLKE